MTAKLSNPTPERLTRFIEDQIGMVPHESVLIAPSDSHGGEVATSRLDIDGISPHKMMCLIAQHLLAYMHTGVYLFCYTEDVNKAMVVDQQSSTILPGVPILMSLWVSTRGPVNLRPTPPA